MIDSMKGAGIAPATNSPAAEAPGKRTEEVRAQRRRRAETTHEFSHRLSVNEQLLEPHKFAYRYINDKGGRLHDKTVNDDWDVIKDPSIKSDADSEGAPVRKMVGANQDGSPIHAYLCRKPVEFHNDDRAKQQRRTDELMASVMRGKHQGPEALSAEQPTTYVPGPNSLEVKTGARVTTYKP